MSRHHCVVLSSLAPLLLAACQPKPRAAGMDETEQQRLNRGIVELSQRLQDTENQRDQLRAELEAARARIEELEAGK